MFSHSFKLIFNLLVWNRIRFQSRVQWHMSSVWSHKFDYQQHHNHALYAYLHVNICVITFFLYEQEKKRRRRRRRRVYSMLGGNWTPILSLHISSFFCVWLRFIYWSEQNEWAKVCKVMIRSCTFHLMVYVYISNIK